MPAEVLATADAMGALACMKYAAFVAWSGQACRVVHPFKVGQDLHRYWIEFRDSDAHGCRLPSRCGVTAWSESDALDLVAEMYCARDEAPAPSSIVSDFDVSELDDDANVGPNLGVPVWRGIWYPFLTRS